MKNAIYWIALQSILGYGANEVIHINNKFDCIKDIFDKSITFDDVKFIGEKAYKKLKNFSLKKAEAIVEYCVDNDIQIITLDDEEYPFVLKQIKNPPAVLYIKGKMPDFDEELCLGMVGTRDCSLNSMITASTLAYRLAQAGAIVISGGANGIDTKCSQGAIFAKKPSVIIRPCGIDNDYLSNLKEIRDKVIETGGAIISEVQPLGKVEKNAFQIRNRLIAALSTGVVAIEVPEKSGVIITIGYALEYGKDVYVMPGDISDEKFKGSNKLLHDGASPVYAPIDILNEYLYNFAHKLKLDNARSNINEDRVFLGLQKKYSRKSSVNNFAVQESKKKTHKKKTLTRIFKNNLTKEQTNNSKIDSNNNKIKLSELPFVADENTKIVYNCFGEKDISADEISEKCGLDSADVVFALTDLEINGVINALPGGRFEIK